MRIRYSGSATGLLALDGLDGVNEVTIGRAANSQIRSDDSTVSRKHAIVRRDAGQWILEDLRSAHGVLLGGRKVTRHVPPSSSDSGDPVSSRGPDIRSLGAGVTAN